ncbi:class I SAM-dependent methyltransferase [Mycolicibacter sp. MYC123]|uniref:Class I SAM-dependent methyltransferase n=1 Tax=[Mycobacterium] zoologicum TaxID=2872311 RepID=A0ABU5YI83_9MYCO|nr:class I SAM-dependent methyltransferase [Mycolicibacter sp. MYC123]MEB3049767.1 class I SAM-dependent methyltransferase [Mycolicibacter sp. MYC123]
MAPRGSQGLVLQRDGHRGKAVLTLDQVSYLRSAAGQDALREVAGLALTEATKVTDIAGVRARFGDRTPALVETTLLRRRAAAKLPDTGDWLFTDEALQQASAAAVAVHRAARLAGRVVHDVTCSIGTELAALRGAATGLIGSDIDPIRLAMAQHNLPGVPLLRADALAPVTRDTVVLADPARRSGGRRRFDPADYQPALDRLLDTYAGRDLVVKAAPGIDFDKIALLGFTGEIEVTSWRSSVREACLWSPGLSEAGVRRRAVMLDRGEQITDAEPDDIDARPAGRWLVDPDGAVVRAGLVRQYGARHRLWQLDPDIAYLSGDELPDGVRGFEVLESLPYSEKRLRQALAALDCGSLEVLVRGVREVQADPDALRRRLRLRGRVALSVVITRIGAGAAAKAIAFVCHPSR